MLYHQKRIPTGVIAREFYRGGMAKRFFFVVRDSESKLFYMLTKWSSLDSTKYGRGGDKSVFRVPPLLQRNSVGGGGGCWWGLIAVECDHVLGCYVHSTCPGRVPSELGALSMLEKFSLCNNKLTGQRQVEGSSMCSARLLENVLVSRVHVSAKTKMALLVPCGASKNISRGPSVSRGMFISLLGECLYGKLHNLNIG